MVVLNRIFLVVLIICCGLLVYEINGLNNEYSRLINEGVAELNIIKDMSLNSNRRHILFYKIISEKDLGNQKVLINQWSVLKTLNSTLFDSILYLNKESQDKQQLIQSAQSARQRYNEFCESKIQLALSGGFQSSQDEIKTFDSLFVDYQNKINNLFLSSHQGMSFSNETLTQRVTSITKGALFLALAPVLGLALIALLIYLLLRSYYSRGKAYY